LYLGIPDQTGQQPDQKHFQFRDDYNLCWVKPTVVPTDFNPVNWTFLWGWLLLFSIASIVMLVYFWKVLNSGSARTTLASRERMLEQIKTYLLAFTIYSGCLTLVFFLAWKQAGSQQAIQTNYTYTFNVLWGLQGAFDVVVWMIAQRKVSLLYIVLGDLRLSESLRMAYMRPVRLFRCVCV
jgi:hypothetical protein